MREFSGVQRGQPAWVQQRRATSSPSATDRIRSNRFAARDRSGNDFAHAPARFRLWRRVLANRVGSACGVCSCTAARPILATRRKCAPAVGALGAWTRARQWIFRMTGFPHQRQSVSPTYSMVVLHAVDSLPLEHAGCWFFNDAVCSRGLGRTVAVAIASARQPEC